MVPIKVNKWNSLVQQVEENRQNILTLSEQPPQFDAKGEWNSTTVYAQNDMINYNGSSYFSLQDSNANHTPGATESAAWWQLLAAQGEQGVQGVQGVPGQTGPNGRGVFAASLVDNEFTVYVENSEVAKNGDVLVVTVNPGTGDNLGDVYLVTNATGTTNIPIANASRVGNIRGAQGIQGPKGDPGPQGPTGPAGAPGGGATYMHIMQLSLLSQPSQLNVGALSSLVICSNQEAPYTNETLQTALGVSNTTRFPANGYVYLYPGGTDFFPIVGVKIKAYGVTVMFRRTPGGSNEELSGVGINDTVVQVG